MPKRKNDYGLHWSEMMSGEIAELLSCEQSIISIGIAAGYFPTPIRKIGVFNILNRAQVMAFLATKSRDEIVTDCNKIRWDKYCKGKKRSANTVRQARSRELQPSASQAIAQIFNTNRRT